MNRSQRRDTALFVLKAHHRRGKVQDQDLPKFELLIRRCRVPDDFRQVLAALNHYLTDIETGRDRYALLMQQDPFNLGEDD